MLAKGKGGVRQAITVVAGRTPAKARVVALLPRRSNEADRFRPRTLYTAEEKFMNRRRFAIVLGTVFAGFVTCSTLFAQDQPKKTDHPGSCAGTETPRKMKKAKKAKKPKPTTTTKS
jgi:hypothetical protein